MSEEIKKPLPQLKEREKLLADGILGGKNTTQAARDAGYAEATAKNMAQRLRLESAFSDRVNTYIEIKQAEALAGNPDGATEEFLNRIQAAEDYATEKGNANARVKAVELRGKVLGLLKDDRGILDTPFSIQIIVPPVESQREIDVTPRCSRCGIAFAGATGFVCGNEECPVMPKIICG